MIDWVALHADAWQLIQADLARDRLSHALLISGPAGIGKLDFAESLAASLLCDQPTAAGRACGHCTSCTWHASGNHPVFRRVRPEAFEELSADSETDKPASAKTDRKKTEQIRSDQ